MGVVFRHTAILLLEVLAGLLAILIIAGGVVAVRLQENAPLQLSFLTPYLEQSLNRIDPNIRVKIGNTLLTWSGWKGPLDLRARNVQVSDAAGQGVATLPDISVSLSLPALLVGEIAPSAIEVVGPDLIVVRTEEGRLQLGFGESEQDAAEPFARDVALLLLRPADEEGHLRRISVRQASVIVLDRRAGETWRLPTVDFQLRRTRQGARLRANATLLQPTGTAAVRAELTVPADQRPASATMEVAGLDPRGLAILTGVPEIERLRVIVGGTMSGTIERSGEVSRMQFSLAAGQGSVALPELYPEPLPVAGANLRGRMLNGFDRLELEQAELTILNGPVLTLSGNATGLASPDLIKVEALLSAGAAATETVLRYWPETLGRGARSWIAQNIVGGQAEEGRIELALAIPRAAPQNAELERAEGYFRASGLTVTYLKGLPPLQAVVGEGRLSANRLSMTIASGHVGALVATGGTVEVSDLDQEPQIVTIDGQVKGPVRDALELLDRDRLGYPRKIGIDPKTASGSSEAHLWFRLPAVKDVDLEDVQIRVEAKLLDAALTEAAFGAPVGEGELDLVVDTKGLSMSGTAEIADTPTQLEWRENFAKAEFDTRIQAQMTPDTQARAALGFDAAPWVEGPTPLEIRYTRSGEKATAEVTADLTQATLAAEPIGWGKGAGVPGHARATLFLRKRDVTALEKLSVEAGDLSLAGQVLVGSAAGASTRVALDHLAWGGSRLQLVEAQIGDSISVRIGAGVLDAAPFIDRRKEGKGTDADAGAEEEPGPAFRLIAPQLTELRTGDDRGLAPASLDVAHNGERWQSANLSGGLPGGKKMSLRYGLDPGTGRRGLRIESDDAGALLRTARLLETVVGGALTVEGEAEEPGLAAPLPVRAEVQDYRVVRGKVMAKILQQAKLEDINSLLAQEGIPFARFTGRMRLTDEGIEIEKARGYGAALGITAQGKIDLEADRLAIEGTIVPAYVVSQIVGEIPLIGRILTGGEGEGLFAATYRAEGPLDDPKVSVNPLAALAPGFLRGLFGIFDGNGGDGGDGDFTPLPPREQR
jgi:uncharacterized protein YhdP